MIDSSLSGALKREALAVLSQWIGEHPHVLEMIIKHEPLKEAVLDTLKVAPKPWERAERTSRHYEAKAWAEQLAPQLIGGDIIEAIEAEEITPGEVVSAFRRGLTRVIDQPNEPRMPW